MEIKLVFPNKHYLSSEIDDMANLAIALENETRQNGKRRPLERIRKMAEKNITTSFYPGGKRCIFAEADTKKVGYVVYLINGKDPVFVEELYVRPEFRGHSVGSRLISMVLKESKLKGKNQVNLIALGNSMDFYSRLGFTRLEEGKQNEMSIRLD
jgi:ribosomal protein S18 acetylase RimI-like enzyme